MPFQSEKQRRYLWANEPEIARDWSKKYGSRVRKVNGGIMNLGYQLPDLWNKWQQHKTASNLMKEDPTTRDYHQLAAHDFMQRFPNTPAWAGKGLATGYQLASEFGKGILNPSKMSSFLPRALEESRLNRAGIEGLTPDQQDRYDSFSKTFDPTLKSMYPTDQLASLRNIIGTKFSGSAQAGEPDKNNYNYSQEFADLYKQGKYDNLSLAMQDADRYNRGETTNYEKIIGKNPITDIYDRDYTAGEHYNMTPDAKIKAMRQDLKSVPEHIRRQTNFPTASHMRRQTNFPTSTAQQFANLGQPHKDFEEMDPARPQRKGFLDTVRGGITNVLDNTVIGKIAALNNPFNPRAANYQPGFRESVDQYRKQGLVSPGGKVMSGPMQGYNMVSGFGSNNYRNMISNRMNKQGMFGLRGPNNEIRNQQKYNQLKAELQKETQRQRNLPSTAPGMGGQSYNQYAGNMSAGALGMSGPKGKEMMARGGIASLWPR